MWKTIPGEINIFTAGSKDSVESLVLEPLQIRSFRINLKKKITMVGRPPQPRPIESSI